MLLFILQRGHNADTYYKNYPEWATYLALGIIGFVIFILFKGKIKPKK